MQILHGTWIPDSAASGSGDEFQQLGGFYLWVERWIELDAEAKPSAETKIGTTKGIRSESSGKNANTSGRKPPKSVPSANATVEKTSACAMGG